MSCKLCQERQPTPIRCFRKEETFSKPRLNLFPLVQMAFPSELSFIESLKSKPRRYFYERHPRIAIAMILIVFLAPFVGIVVNGLPGAVWGVGLSVLGYFLTPYAVQKLGQ